MENPKESTTKTPRSDKWVQQGYETHVQHIQINCVFIYNEWIFKKQNYKPNTIYNYSKENEILKDAFKTSPEFICWKLQFADERNQRRPD